MSTLDGDALDRHITGNYGEDRFTGEALKEKIVDQFRQRLYDEIVSNVERLDADRHLLGGLVFLDVKFPRARRHAPVDELHRVAGLVGPRLHILDARAEERRTLLPVAQRIGQTLHRQLKLPRIERVVVEMGGAVHAR